MNHKWGKEYRTERNVYHQKCERCGFVRGVHYTRASKYYYVPGGTAHQLLPKCGYYGTGSIMRDIGLQAKEKR